MATVNSVIEYVDRLKPNIYTDEDKYTWISRLEGMISHDVLQEEGSQYISPDDADIPLQVSAPYDDIYALYVAAMIDFYNKEYNNYNNSVLMFQDRLDAFKAWYIQNHAASKARNFRNVMG